MDMKKENLWDSGFISGAFYAAQFLVLEEDQPTIAAEILEAAGITREIAFKEQKSTGYRTREMNKFIRENL